MSEPSSLPLYPRPQSARRCENFLQTFLSYTEQASAPLIYKKAAAVFTVSAALTRRVWTLTKQDRVSPAFMIVLVGSSGTGKSPAINPTKRLLGFVDWTGNPARQAHGLRLGADRITESALFEFLGSEHSVRVMEIDGKKETFSSGVFVAGEAGTILTELKDRRVGTQLGGRLIDCLDALPAITRSLKSDDDDISIVERPVISILVGLQAELLMDFFPESTWHQGFTPRGLFVHAKPLAEKDDIFALDGPTNDDYERARLALEKDLVHDLEQIVALSGKYHYDRPAAEAINKWFANGKMPTAPDHPMLSAYREKRVLHLLRLCMVHAAAKRNELIVLNEDVQDAIEFLHEIERDMPKMFENLTTTESDDNIIQRVVWAVRAFWLRNKRPAPEVTIRAQLAQLVRQERVEPLIQHMLDVGRIRKERLLTPVGPGIYGQYGFIPGHVGPEQHEEQAQ